MKCSKLLLLLLGAALALLASSQSPTDKCPCPDGYKQIEVKKKVCRPGPCVKPKFGSLGIVIDDTASMGAEIFAVRAQISNIMASNTVFEDYVIARFGDPYVKSVIRSSDATVIQTFVNAIAPSGGGDCPEFAMSGIEDAANEALKDSIFIMFTDASAKDASKLAAVKALLLSKNIRLYVIGTGTFCGSGVYKGEFDDLATATGGSVTTLTAKTSVNEVLDFIALAVSGKYSFDSFPKNLDDLKHLVPLECCETVVEYNCTKIEAPCPPGYKRVVMHNKVCALYNACKKKPAGSLGFVIDDTASMGAEIFAVRAHISGIIANNSVFEDYVIARFGDPYVKSVIRSSDATAIQTFVNAIAPSAGGDCPEFAMSGIEDAAKEARDNSVLVLFTDASAKDANKTAAVKALLLSKNIRLYVIGTGTFCGPDVYKGEFDDLAKATGGSVMTLTAKTSIGEVLDFIGLAAAGMVPFDSLPASLDDLRKLPPLNYCWVQEISTCLCDC